MCHGGFPPLSRPLVAVVRTNVVGSISMCMLDLRGLLDMHNKTKIVSLQFLNSTFKRSNDPIRVSIFHIASLDRGVLKVIQPINIMADQEPKYVTRHIIKGIQSQDLVLSNQSL